MLSVLARDYSKAGQPGRAATVCPAWLPVAQAAIGLSIHQCVQTDALPSAGDSRNCEL